MALLVVVKITYGTHFTSDVLVAVFASALAVEALALYVSFAREERVEHAVRHHARNKLQTIYQALETLSVSKNLDRTERLLIDMALDACENLTVSVTDALKTGGKDFDHNLNLIGKIKESDLPTATTREEEKERKEAVKPAALP